ncbi:MAG: class I SAM-dependent methyltransferase [Solirubrobacteraceae bacterium]|nr:class I SAM-dependent methyltransferase [Patulibacter sp.]
MTDDGIHAARVEAAFRLQAGAFEQGPNTAVFTSDATWITDRIPCPPDGLVLDVAAGTGHAGRQLASRARAVVALDATMAMLEAGRASALADGLDSVVFMRGDAEALPFLSGTFDVVLSRYAFHHLRRPSVVLAEMRRCVTPGGTLVLADLVADDDPAVAQRQDRLEILRDPSHAALLSVREATALFTELGTGPVDVEVRSTARPLGPWLEQTRTAPEAVAEITAALDAELAGGPSTGLSPTLVDGERWFTQRFAALQALVD